MLSAYLFYQDTCEAAFNYYAKVLGGTIDAMMRLSDAPPSDMPPGPPGRDKTIMHARMTLPGGAVRHVQLRISASSAALRVDAAGSRSSVAATTRPPAAAYLARSHPSAGSTLRWKTPIDHAWNSKASRAVRQSGGVAAPHLGRHLVPGQRSGKSAKRHDGLP